MLAVVDEGTKVAPGSVSKQSRRSRSATHAVTLDDVARIAGVSAQTVSRALRDPGQVSTAAFEAVTAAVRTSGYVPNLSARNLASNTSKLVATLVPSISTSIVSETVQSAVDILTPDHYQLILGFTDYREEREEDLVRQLLGRRPDSVLLIGTAHTDATVTMLANAGVPVVEAWGWTQAPIDTLIGFSDAQATEELLETLYERGYRHFAYVGSTAHGDPRAHDRVQGYFRAHRRLFGELVEPGFIDSSGIPLNLRSGGELLSQVRRTFPDTDAILFATDILANGALLSATAQGVRIPGDVAIAGFGDFDLSAAISPGLTTVRIPAQEIGRLAAEHLLTRMGSRAHGGTVIDVGYSIVEREST